jgi:hypothetical protein
MGLTVCSETWPLTTKLHCIMSQTNEDLIYTMKEATNNADYRLGYYEIQLHKNGLMRNVQNCVIKRKLDSFH